jgi:C-terminal processing protease CtpA/Prc
MINLVLSRLLPQNPVPIFLSLFVALYSIVVLVMMRNVFGEKPLGIPPELMRFTDCSAAFRRKRKKLFIFVCAVPCVVCIIHFIFARYKHNMWATWHYYGIFYLASVLLAALPLADFAKITRKLCAPLVTAFAVAAFFHTIIYPMAWSSTIRNHTYESFTESFISMTHDMEEHYSLKDWKKADIPAVRDKILPLVEYAERTNDKGLFHAAMSAYAYYFYDGHVKAFAEDPDVWYIALLILAGNDYGFSMVQLDDGRFIAVSCSPETQACRLGIHNGTEILQWNGKPVAQAASEIECIYGANTWPVKENEDFFRPVWLSTRGINDSPDLTERLIAAASIKSDSERSPAKVGFITDSGKYREIEVEAIGAGINRLEFTYLSLLHQYDNNAFWLDTNLESVMVNDDTAYMLRFSETNFILLDNLSYLTGRYPVIKNKLKRTLQGLREQGMKNLIIDARCNSGGFSAMGNETASLFSSERFVVDTKGSFIDGVYKEFTTEYVEADGSFSDINVVLLTDAFCVSAGDYLVKVLGKCPNVTVMGFTSSNCACQTTGGLSYLTDGIDYIVYPVGWMYEPDGTRLIDTDETRTCTLPLDVKVPLTYEAALTMTSEDPDRPDYLLEYAIEYLKHQR